MTANRIYVEWNWSRKLAFRTAFCFFLLINFPAPLEVIPKSDVVLHWYVLLWQKLGTWVGQYVFHLRQITTTQNGSGDQTISYLTLLCALVVTVVATVAWSLLDRKRANYIRLNELLHMYVRYVLAFTLIAYGMFKVIPSQFIPPNPFMLARTYAESSPMGVLWTMMGASMPYTIFSGLCECTAGLLLIPRRTVALGAALATAVLTNIVLLNFCYDVPVKVYSCELLLDALFVLAPHTGRLACLFVLNRSACPAELAPRFGSRRLRLAHLVAKCLVVCAAFGFPIRLSLQGRSQMQAMQLAAPLYGLFRVEDPSVCDSHSPQPKWIQIAFAFKEAALVRNCDGSSAYLRIDADPQHHKLNLYTGSKQNGYSYSIPDRDHLVLNGPTTIRLKKLGGDDLLLVNRGFRWINEFPFNR